MMVCVGPQDRFYQVLLERCIEVVPNDFWDVYKDGDLYIHKDVYDYEVIRARCLYP